MSPDRARSRPGRPRPRGRPPGPSPAAVADRLHSAAIHVLRRVRREDDAAGIAGPRGSALSVIVYAGPIALGALAAAENVRPPTMTRLVAALESQGLVTRDPDPRDGRVTLIRATAAGVRLLEHGRDRRVAALARDLASLSPGELTVVDRALHALERFVGPPNRRRGAAASE